MKFGFLLLLDTVRSGLHGLLSQIVLAHDRCGRTAIRDLLEQLARLVTEHNVGARLYQLLVWAGGIVVVGVR